MAEEDQNITPEAEVAPVAELTQSQRTSIANQGSIAARRTDFSTQHKIGLGLFASMYETHMQTTTHGEGIRAIDQGRFESFDRDYNFNPYTHYLANKDTHGDMETFINNGYFSNVYSQEAYDSRRKILNQLVEEEQRLIGANKVGVVLGGLSSIIDVTSLIPGVNFAKWGMKGAKIGRILASRPGRYASYGVQQSVLQETGLHILNDLHTIEESAMATAITGALGGGIGLFASARHIDSPLNPRNPQYFLRDDQPVGVGIRRVGQSMSEATIVKYANGKFVEAADTQAGKSLSAAAVQTSKMARAGAAKVEGPVRKGVSAFGKAGELAIKKTVGKAAPAIRIQNYASTKMKDFGAKLFDMSGMILRENEGGNFGRSAETEARLQVNKYNDAVVVPNKDAYEGLILKLAELENKGAAGRTADAVGRGAAKVKDVVNDIKAGPSRESTNNPENTTQASTLRENEFGDIINRTLDEGLDDDFVKSLKDRFGDEGAELILNSAKERSTAFVDFLRKLGDDLEEMGILAPGQRIEDYDGIQLWLGDAIRGNKTDFKNELLEMFRGKPSSDFLEEFGLTVDDFKALGVSEISVTRKLDTGTEIEVIGKERGLQIKNEILEDWSGEFEANAARKLEEDIEDAEFEAEASAKEAVRLAAEIRKGITSIKGSHIETAKALRDKHNKSRQRRANTLEKNRAAKVRLEQELKLAQEQAKLAEAAVDKAVKSGRNKYRAKAEVEVKEAQALYDFIIKTADDATPNQFAKDKKAAQDNLIEADIRLQNTEELVINDVRKRTAKKPPANNRTSYIRGRLNELDKKISKAEKQAKIFDDELKLMDDAISTAQAKADREGMLQKMRNQAKPEVSKRKNKAKRELKRLKKTQRRNNSRAPLSVYVDEIVDVLSKTHSSTSVAGKMSDEIGETGRLKERMWLLTKEETRRLKRKGYLSSDRFGDMQSAITELSKRAALKKTFGHLGTSPDEIMNGLKKEVEVDFDFLIRQADDADNAKLVKKLLKEKESALEDVELSIKRFMGRLGLPENPDDMFHFSLAKAREAAYSIHGSGFLVASQTDVANVMFTTGFGTLSLRSFKTMFKAMRDDFTAPEVRRLMVSSELMIGGGRSVALSGADELRLSNGIGRQGSRRKYLTSLYDRGSQALADATTMFSGMKLWNSRLKMLAMLEQRHNVLRIIDSYDDLLSAASAKDPAAMRDISNMAAAGIGSEQIARFKRVMGSKRPKLDENGAYELDTKQWLEKGADGQAAYDDMMVIMDMAQSRAVMSPTMGDTPFLMSGPVAKMLLQFQTYGFVIMTKFMMPAFQRMANYGDMDAFLTFGLNMMLGANVVASKDILRGGEIKERTNGEWAYDIIDRSGYLTWASAPVSMAAFATGIGETSRYSQVNARMGTLGGPVGGLVSTVLDVSQAEDGEGRRKAAAKLLPFKMHQQVFDVITGAE